MAVVWTVFAVMSGVFGLGAAHVGFSHWRLARRPETPTAARRVLRHSSSAFCVCAVLFTETAFMFLLLGGYGLAGLVASIVPLFAVSPATGRIVDSLDMARGSRNEGPTDDTPEKTESTAAPKGA